MADPAVLPPLPPKWTDTEARKVIANQLTNDTDCDDTDCAAAGITTALGMAGYVIWPAALLVALSDALTRLTCDYRESTTDPGTCTWCYAKPDHDRHRTVAAVLAEAGNG